jgi:hypothetical protein
LKIDSRGFYTSMIFTMRVVAANSLGRFFESVGDLLSEDAHVSRGLGSDPDLVTFHTQNGDLDIAVNDQGLACLPFHDP